jgi:uncharacterized protein (TIGR03435 family)
MSSLFALLLGIACLQAQPELAFEVASIRPSAPGERGSGVHTNDGSVRTNNTTLQYLIQLAYGVQEYQVAGGPGWVRSDGYDLMATFEHESEKNLTNEQKSLTMRARARSLLADRFQLKLREDTRELPVYAMVVAKNDHKLKVSEQNSQHMNTNRNNGAGKITAGGAKLDSLADRLGDILGRPVVNETGLDGRFDFTIEWTSDESLAAGSATGPSIFTAIQEQLGLKLESKKGPVRMLVIERAERPSEN